MNHTAAAPPSIQYGPFSNVRAVCDNALADLGGGGGMPGARPPYGTQFFRFGIHFHQNAPVSEVHAPQQVHAPATGNPGSTTVTYFLYKTKLVGILTTSCSFQIKCNGQIKCSEYIISHNVRRC